MALLRRLFATLPLLTLPACGGGSGSPTSPNLRTPPPVPHAPVTVVVFYDENGDGLLGADEVVRLPGVEVMIGDATAKTAVGGRAVVQAPQGTQTLTLVVASIPAFFTPPPPRTLTVPASDEVLLPVTLPTPRRHNVYMAFGDSITVGDGSSDGSGYRNLLEQQLASYLGAGEVDNEGQDGTFSSEGAARIGRSLSQRNPAYTLILYGTNDWNTLACQNGAGPPCQTTDSVRSMIEQAKALGSLPVLSTIIPADPALDAPERNQWVEAENRLLQDIARAENIPLADSAKLFLAESNLPALYSDHVHPNDAGYELIARAFFAAVAGPRSATGAQAFSFRAPRR